MEFLFWLDGGEGAGQGEGLLGDSVSPLWSGLWCPIFLPPFSCLAAAAAAAEVVRGELETEAGVERESRGVEQGDDLSRSSPLTMDEISVSSAPVCEVVLSGNSRWVVWVYTVEDGPVNTMSCRTGLSRTAANDTRWSGHRTSCVE